MPNSDSEKRTHIVRNFGPVYDSNSRILILGSFPSVKSREAEFYYGHPQNRFWPVMFSILGESPVSSREDKIRIMLSHGIALWDVIDECDIIGSSDSSITNAKPVPVMRILECADIRAIYCNGSASYNLYCKYLEPVTGIKAEKLPSTSPANAAWTLEKLRDAWKNNMFKTQ